MREITEGQSRFWTVVFGGITSLGLVAGGGLFGLLQYLQNQKAAEIAATMDAKKPFYSLQLQLCESASRAAATIANSDDVSPAEAKKMRAEFWQLYWGPMGIVEDEQVAGAMVEMGKCIDGAAVPCQRQSLTLANTCRKLISESWNLKLPTIREPRSAIPGVH